MYQKCTRGVDIFPWPFYLKREPRFLLEQEPGLARRGLCPRAWLPERFIVFGPDQPVLVGANSYLASDASKSTTASARIKMITIRIG
jgi:hypothetical protein